MLDGVGESNVPQFLIPLFSRPLQAISHCFSSRRLRLCADRGLQPVECQQTFFVSHTLLAGISPLLPSFVCSPAPYLPSPEHPITRPQCVLFFKSLTSRMHIDWLAGWMIACVCVPF